MTSLRAILQELWGLFVDDGAFALLILIWLFVGWLLPRISVPPDIACVVFAVGFAVLLIESTLRRAGRG